MKEIKLNVEGIKCGGCENRIQNSLNNIPDVDSVAANHETGIVTIQVKDSVDEKIIREELTNLGFDVKGQVCKK